MSDEIRLKMLKLLEEMTLEIDEFKKLSSSEYGEATSTRARTIHAVLMTYQPKVLEIAKELGCPARTFERKR